MREITLTFLTSLVIVHFKLPIKLQENYPIIQESYNNLYKQFMTYFKLPSHYLNPISR